MATQFTHLFSPTTIGSMSLKNRLVRSATYEAKADPNGGPTQLYLDFYRRLANGGVGLIITGLAYPEEDGKLPRTIAVDREDRLETLKQIPEVIHGAGNDCKVALQIGHTGRQLPATVDRTPVAPSPILEPFTGRMPREMKRHEIEAFIEKSAAAIGYAKRAGFDAVQVHAAHGWLLSSFLSPHTNHRKDRYGGKTENRARVMTEIIRKAKDEIGMDFPVLVKMNACDFVESGIELVEALELGKIFEKSGYAALEISSGMWETITRDPEDIGWRAERIPEARKRIGTVADEAYHRRFARAFHQKIQRAKIILVGGMKTPSLMDDIVACGDADLIALSRPLIREPDLPNRWLGGGSERASCISCNQCLETLREEKGLRCYLSQAVEPLSKHNEIKEK